MNNLQHYRKRAGLSQAQLAEKVDISHRTLQDYEQNRKPLEKAAAITVLRMARILGCSVEDLIDREAPTVQPPSVEQSRGYTPVCPRGFDDCVRDPAYIKHHHPEWYADLYGDKTPEDAAHEKNGCFDRVEEDPDMEYYCYDDEDK